MDRVLYTVLRVVWMDRDLFLKWGKQNKRGRKIDSRKKQIRERDNKAVEMIAELIDNRSGSASDYPDSDVMRFVNTVFDQADRFNWSVDFSKTEEWDVSGNIKPNVSRFGVTDSVSPNCFVEMDEDVSRAEMLACSVNEIAGRHFHLLKNTPQGTTHQVHINTREQYRAEVFKVVCREVSRDFRISTVTVAAPGRNRNDGITIHCPNTGAQKSIVRDLAPYLSDNDHKLNPTVLTLTAPDQQLKGVSYSMRPSNFFIHKSNDVGMEKKYRNYQDFITLRAGLIYAALRDSAPGFFNVRSSSHNFGKFKECVGEYFEAAGLDLNDPSKQANAKALDASAAKARRKALKDQESTSCWSRNKGKRSQQHAAANQGGSALVHGRASVDRGWGVVFR